MTDATLSLWFVLWHDDVVVQLKSGASRKIVGPEVDAGGVGGGLEGSGRGDVATQASTERFRVNVFAVEQLQTVVTARSIVIVSVVVVVVVHALVWLNIQ